MRRLPKQIQERIEKGIDSLAVNPRPPGAKKMKGFENMYRLRVGDYRVIYQVEDDVLTVLVVRVGHRRDIYR